MSNAPTERFSNRVEDYVRYRPSYPAELIGVLEQNCGLTASSIIADVGSGTGLLSEIFLKKGNTVFGVEPNAPMREAGEKHLRHFGEKFCSAAGSAEATTLADKSTDFITAGQAFHWFDREKCRAEFKRILKPGGYCVLIWNERQEDADAFSREIESLLRTFGNDYVTSSHRRIGLCDIEEFFRSPVQTAGLPNRQEFDLDGLIGRLRSSSYVPVPGEATFEPMEKRVREIFADHQTNGLVAFDYETRIYWANLISK